jgi:hypothetical protein
MIERDVSYGAGNGSGCGFVAAASAGLQKRRRAESEQDCTGSLEKVPARKAGPSLPGRARPIHLLFLALLTRPGMNEKAIESAVWSSHCNVEYP